MIVRCTSREEWLKARSGDVTSTSISALFNENPFVTEYELWHRIKGNLEVQTFNNVRARWGLRHQPAIAQGIIEDNGFTLVEDGDNAYIKHPRIRGFGTSFDYIVDCPQRGRGLLEIKTAALSEYLKKWEFFEGEREAPTNYELQVQAQLMCAQEIGVKWAAIGVAFGINDDPLLLYRNLYDDTALAIERALDHFWKSIDENKPPMPDYERDAETVIRLNQAVVEGREVDLTSHNRLGELCAEYKRVAGINAETGKKKQGLKAEIFSAIGNVSKAKAAGGYKISTFKVAPKKFMMETNSYRDMRITEEKKK